jgi:hypothetical protein
MIGWGCARNPDADAEDHSEDWDRRVRFICCDDHGSYSPAVYMRQGGGREALSRVRAAAAFLRPDDTGSSAAGLCGFLFKEFGYDSDTGGTMSLHPAPEKGPDGKVDWEAYGGDGDVILINVHECSARCVYGVIAGEEIRDLPLGKRRSKHL